jgi:hypothetical protein
MQASFTALYQTWRMVPSLLMSKCRSKKEVQTSIAEFTPRFLASTKFLTYWAYMETNTCMHLSCLIAVKYWGRNSQRQVCREFSIFLNYNVLWCQAMSAHAKDIALDTNHVFIITWFTRQNLHWFINRYLVLSVYLCARSVHFKFSIE